MWLSHPARTLSLKPLVCLVASIFAGNSTAEVIPGSVPTDPYWQAMNPRLEHALLELEKLRPSLFSMRPDLAPLAVNLPVSNCLDDGGPNTLRTVIERAAIRDTVDLTGLTCSSITLQNGAIPVFADDLIIKGPGSDKLTIDGDDSDRVFVHLGTGILSLTGLSIAHGRAQAAVGDSGIGGCIASARVRVGASVRLTDSAVHNCYTSGIGAYGGGIFTGTLIMSNSTLSSNVALGAHPSSGTGASGGGAYAWLFSSLVNSTVTGNTVTHIANGNDSYEIGAGLLARLGGEIKNSTIDNNYAANQVAGSGSPIGGGFGGGVAMFGYSLTLSNSTVSGNIAHNQGGGLHIRTLATLLVNNSTIANNFATAGGAGVFFQGYFPSINSGFQSTIIANNFGPDPDISSAKPFVINGANNLLSILSAPVTFPGDTLIADPGLQALADNGGATRTHALIAGSPAISRGNNLARLVTDQRGVGFVRAMNTVDIGAVEFEKDRIFKDGFDR